VAHNSLNHNTNLYCSKTFISHAMQYVKQLSWEGKKRTREKKLKCYVTLLYGTVTWVTKNKVLKNFGQWKSLVKKKDVTNWASFKIMIYGRNRILIRQSE
jgi:hypothetical protein